ncbi:MAG: XisI protein [Xenococcaceae cyanobacterium MO_207.B15]|nr:XisI protein [Xenococcaceae cyanobacterium MO_207.B15]MDJ0743024.1 XisI protein [Xenococcaceae cyanobacterium MO_167.B27]
MDKVTCYRQYIQDFLTEQTQGKVIGGDIETEIVFDVDRERFLLIDLGWKEHQRIYNCVIHLEIRDNKIWIQRNQTDQPIADVLISMGVAKEDIILGLQPPYIRKYTGLGVA